MAKSNKNKAKRPTGKSRAVSNRLSDYGERLDAAALAWRRLLLDPCNAPLVAPCYAGFGTGSYIRVKSIINQGNVIDGVYVFQPGTNLAWSGATATANASFPISATGTMFSLGGTGGTQVRALSACVKVRYLSSESSRSGIIGLAVGTPFIIPATTSQAQAALTQSPCVTRFGETSHEVKWIPSAADEEFHDGLAANYQPRSSALTVTFSGVPANSVQLEFVACYEIEGGYSGAIPSNAVAPPSVNTTNHVLRSLGDYTMWAFTNVAVPVLKATAHAGVAMYARGLNARQFHQGRIMMP